MDRAPLTPCIVGVEVPDASGYVRIRHKGKRVLAHRLAYAIANGLDPFFKGGQVMHECDNRLCRNAEHLSLGTQSDNMQDMISKGRQNPPHGTRHPGAKLTVTDVLAIKAEYVHRHPEHGQTAIAKRYGVSQSVISTLVNDKSYKL